MSLSRSDIARFWSKVDRKGPNECWEWRASTFAKVGYGYFWLNGRGYGAHRIAYAIAKGEIPDGMFVCHTCDNRLCVNPDHLVVGTQKDNLSQMVARGRSAKGERNGRRLHPESVPRGEQCSWAKLTWDQAREIRRRYKRGECGYGRLGQEFGVAHTVIRSVVLGRTWKEEPHVALA